MKSKKNVQIDKYNKGVKSNPKNKKIFLLIMILLILFFIYLGISQLIEALSNNVLFIGLSIFGFIMAIYLTIMTIKYMNNNFNNKN